MLRIMNKDPIDTVLRTVPFLRDVPDRALKAVGREAAWYSVAAGWPLFEADEAPEAIYFVLTGSFGAFRTGPDGSNELVGHIRGGEPVGEMALLANEPHRHSVYALRDSEVLRLSRAGFNRLVRAEPDVLQRLIRVILMRTRAGGRRATRAEPKVFTFVATSPTIDLRLRANLLRTALNRLGLRVGVVEETEGANKPAAFFEALEASNDIVILCAALKQESWLRLAMRQADRIWVYARSDARPSRPLMPEDPSPSRQFRLIDLILLHPARPVEISTQDWIEAAGAARAFHWTGTDATTTARLARVMAGRSVGVVFSGGGARAYAHIGVIQALRERSIPIDLIGGASMGAVIAACVALGWDTDEIDRRIRKAFVETNPLGDFNLPVVGMVRGERVRRRLQEHFGEALIEDLTIPFFAVSTNLTDASVRLHRSGLLRQALRATISLPGILPPVVDGGQVLVDGAVLNNFPVNVMRDLHRGLNIGCDVARAPEGLKADGFINPPGFFGWVFRNGVSAPPPIADLLMRAATVSVNPNAGRELVDLLIIPEIKGVELQDWKRFDVAVEEGYRDTLAMLDAMNDRLPVGVRTPG
jgi:NTE family protein